MATTQGYNGTVSWDGVNADIVQNAYAVYSDL